MYNANENGNIKGDLALIAQQNARQYRAKVARERKIKKCKKVALGILVAAFFITGMKIVGDNDLEAFEIVEAKESETEYTTLIRNGEILYKDLIETEEGYRWKVDTHFSEGTEVSVLFSDNGTTNPIDDVVLNVTER